MKNRIYFLFFLLASAVTFAKTGNSPLVNETLRKKYPHSLITPDYGIVTEQDLAWDHKRYRITTPYNPYDPNASWVAHWQCVPTNDVTNRYTSHYDIDKIEGLLCLMDTTVKMKGSIHKYIIRRALPIAFCREYIKNWNKITRNEPIVCFGAEGGNFYEFDKNGVPVFLWVWNKFRTKKGCYAYFDDCEPSK